MVTDGDYTYHGKHWVMHKTVESIHYAHETNITFYVNILQK